MNTMALSNSHADTRCLLVSRLLGSTYLHLSDHDPEAQSEMAMHEGHLSVRMIVALRRSHLRAYARPRAVNVRHFRFQAIFRFVRYDD